MFDAPSIAVAVARWPLPSRRPTPSSPPPCCRVFHPHCHCAVHRHCHRAVHQRRCRCVAIAPSVAIAFLSRHPLPLPSRRPSTLLPLRHHCHCAVHRRCRHAVHCHCCCGCPLTSLPSRCHSAFCCHRDATLLRDGRCHRVIHHRHHHHLAVASSIAVAITPFITVVATVLPSRHPLPSPQCRPLLAESPRCRRAVYHRCCLLILLSVVSTHSPSCRTSSL